MNTVEYTIENNPNSSDDKVIRDGIVNLIVRLSMRKRRTSVYLQKTMEKL
jgi:hypothetical protein